MKNTANRWDVGVYAWLIIATLTTKPFIPVIGYIMMTFCLVMSWVTDYNGS